jgi:DNA repair exonuclease SbcCD ATPase subunit
MREKVKDRRREVEAEIKVRKDAQVLLEKLKEIEVKDEELSKALQVLEKWKNVMPLSVEEYRGKRRVVLEQLRRWRDAKRVEGLVQELRKIRDDLSGRMSNISEKLKYLKDGRCWVCGSEVDTQALLQRANTDISHISSTLSQVEEQLRTLELVYVKGKGVDRDGLIRDIGEVRKRLGDVDEYKKAIEIKAKADEQERRRTALQEVDLSVLKELEWELETARKWEKGLGDDGVVAYILQKVLAVFNAMMKKYGEVLGIDVSFRIGSKGQLEIDVSDGFKSMGKLNWWSGSERYAIMLVVMLGLSEFLAYQGKGTNLLILDEVFAPFDEVWRERLVELLKWLQAGDKTVVVITHHDDVKKAVDWSGVWVVEKRNGVSTLISNA